MVSLANVLEVLAAISDLDIGNFNWGISWFSSCPWGEFQDSTFIGVTKASCPDIYYYHSRLRIPTVSKRSVFFPEHLSVRCYDLLNTDFQTVHVDDDEIRPSRLMMLNVIHKISCRVGNIVPTAVLLCSPVRPAKFNDSYATFIYLCPVTLRKKREKYVLFWITYNLKYQYHIICTDVRHEHHYLL